MALDRFFIGPINSGLELDQKPWLIPDDAFAQLYNAYIFRGRVRKRFGSVFMNTSVDISVQQMYSRLRVKIGTTNADGTSSGPYSCPGSSFVIGQMFTIGPSFFTVVATGTPGTTLFAEGTIGETDVTGDASGTVPGAGGAIGMYFIIDGYTYTVVAPSGALTPGVGAPGTGTFDTTTGAYTFDNVGIREQIYFYTGVTAGTFNTTTGAFDFTGKSFFSTDIYYYPAQPVMGIATYDSDEIEAEPTFAFDQQFAYYFDQTEQAWERLGTAVWTGSNSNFFWTANWIGYLDPDFFLFVTNYKVPDLTSSPPITPDGIYYYNGSCLLTNSCVAGSPDFYKLNPVLNGTTRLVTALMLVPFENRLIALNTIESTSGQLAYATSPNTDGSGNYSQTVDQFNSNAFAIGDNFLVGNTLYTVTSVANSAVALAVNYFVTYQNNTPPTATFNGATGALVITGNGNNINTPVYYISSGTPTAYNVFPYRARYSQVGKPVGPATLPNQTNAWLDIPGLGGYKDAYTTEQMVSSEFIRNRLIVYFETSTWEFAFTFNQVSPYIWQKINTELGAVSTFSTVPFDKVVIGVADVGIHACNGANVDRIDDKIPDSVFNFEKEDSGSQRVCGVRDYYSEMIYWSFPSQERYNVFPNRVLVYNYKTGFWAFNNDAFTFFGTFYNENTIEWESSPQQWDSTLNSWDSGVIEQKFRQVIAGNQEGFMFLILRDTGSNAPSLQITNITIGGAGGYLTVTAINHSLANGDYVYFENINGLTNINNTVQIVGYAIDANTIRVYLPSPPPPEVFQPVTGTYTGGGTLRRVSQIDILTKQYNFYIKQGRNALINKIDFQMQKTSTNADGSSPGVTVDYYLNSSEQSSLNQGISNGALIGNGVLETAAYPPSPYADIESYPLENYQERLWHPVYPIADGEFIQLRIYLSDAQIRNIGTAWADFEMHAMCFYTKPSSSRLE
jgi:hypothetical protein